MKLHTPTLLGMAIGFVGAVILALPGESYPLPVSTVIAGALMLQAGAILWAGGSMWQRRITRDAHPFMAGAIHQVAVGLAFAPFAAGEIWQHGIQFEARPAWALVYLVLFGSIVGYSSYLFALTRLPVAITSLYSYVNPVVAVALGWLFYREPFGFREGIAMLIIFSGVAAVKRFSLANRGTRCLAWLKSAPRWCISAITRLFCFCYKKPSLCPARRNRAIESLFES